MNDGWMEGRKKGKEEGRQDRRKEGRKERRKEVNILKKSQCQEKANYKLQTSNLAENCSSSAVRWHQQNRIQ
jgi:DNA invertase Pin-like site-specific DNA recombinase